MKFKSLILSMIVIAILATPVFALPPIWGPGLPPSNPSNPSSPVSLDIPAQWDTLEEINIDEDSIPGSKVYLGLNAISADLNPITIAGGINVNIASIRSVYTSVLSLINPPVTIRSVAGSSAAGTLIYENLKSKCHDPDSPIMISIDTQSSHFNLALSGANYDLYMSNLEKDWSGKSTIVLDCNGADGYLTITVNPVQDAPEAKNAYITASNAPADEDSVLTGHYTFYDADTPYTGDSEQDRETKWFRNGNELSSLADEITVDSSYVNEEDAWIFAVRVSDGIEWSEWEYSPEFKIVPDYNAPVADAGDGYTGNINEQIRFDGSGSYDTDGTIESYEWDFGDGFTGTGVKPTHTYTKEGTYTVTLTVTDNDDLSHSDTAIAAIGDDEQPEEETFAVDDLMVTRLAVRSEYAKAGDEIEISMDVENKGTEKLKDITISATIQELGLRKNIGPFDLKRKDETSKHITIDVPEDTPEGNYYIRLTFNNDDVRRVKYRQVTIV